MPFYFNNFSKLIISRQSRMRSDDDRSCSHESEIIINVCFIALHNDIWCSPEVNRGEYRAIVAVNFNWSNVAKVRAFALCFLLE